MRFFICGIAVMGLIVGCTDTGDVAIDQDGSISAIEADRDTTRDEPGDEFAVGDPAPKFEGLIGVDDKKHSFEDYADAKALAVVFTCNKCPVAVDYEERLVAFQNDYADKGVQLVAINVNNAEADKLPAMKDRAEEKGFQFSYLYDPSQKVGRDYGAKVTPHVFLLDGKRNLAYVGPVDDNPDVTQVSKSYLRDATDAVLAGASPETTVVEPVGCGIQYE